MLHSSALLRGLLPFDNGSGDSGTTERQKEGPMTTPHPESPAEGADPEEPDTSPEEATPTTSDAEDQDG